MAMPSLKIRLNRLNEARPAVLPGAGVRLGPIQGVLLSVVLNTIGQFLFKAAAVRSDSSTLGLFLDGRTWLALVIYGFSAVIWLWVLSRAQLSLAYPILSITFPLVVALSALFFGEPVSAVRWVGIGAIVIGVSFLSRT